MAKIDRYNGNLIPFANNATGGNRTVFGDVAQSDSLDSNLNADFFAGWESTTDSLTPPSKQDFNALGYTSTALASYLYQMGVPEWNTNQDYYEYSRAIGSDGLVYVSQNGTNLVPNSGNDPVGDLVNWKWEGSNFVDKTSAQTIAGVKTFSSSPIVPTPAAGAQVANKDYVDANFVDKTSAQTITGVKTFSSGPIVPTPTLGTQAANMDYVDSNVGISLATANSYDLGVNQTWQDVTASRSAGVTYTNTTGKAIEVYISAITTAVVTSFTIDSTVVYSSSANSNQVLMSFIIPNGMTYKFIGTFSGTVTWSELR